MMVCEGSLLMPGEKVHLPWHGDLKATCHADRAPRDGREPTTPKMANVCPHGHQKKTRIFIPWVRKLDCLAECMYICIYVCVFEGKYAGAKDFEYHIWVCLKFRGPPKRPKKGFLC